MNKKLTKWVIAMAGLLLAPALAAIEFDEVRDYEDVFVISGEAPSRDLVEVRWDIEENYYLYNNRFLRFITDTEGVVLGEPILPRGEIKFDELLGEDVETYRHELTVQVPLESVSAGIEAISLKVRSQGCLEDELCYPPSQQQLLVRLPPVSPGADLLSALSPTNPADPLFGQAEKPALQPEKAFVFESIGLDAQTALVRFTAQPGYYLYRDKFEFRVEGAPGLAIRNVEMPPGVIKDDPEFGPVPVYYGQVEIPVRLNRAAGPEQEISLEAEFQGCRDGDICYPPMSRSVSFLLPASLTALGAPAGAASKPAPPAAAPRSEQDQLAGLLTSNPARAIFAFFIAGLLLAFTPCVFPMVPILSGIIIGQGESLTTLRAFWLSLVYVLAMAVTYTIAGVLAGLFGQNLQAVFQNPWIISGFVLVFVLLALSMFGFYELQLPGRLQTRLTEASNRQQGGQLWGVAVMGFLSALIVGPCVAPPLMAALIVIGSSGDAVLGGAALFSLAMGMGAPLIVFGVSAGKLVPRAGAWMDVVKAVFGVGLLALAIWLLERILPAGLILFLWGVLAVSCGVYLGALRRTETGDSGWKKLWQALGIVLMTLGVVEIIGAVAGGNNWLRPLDGVFSGSARTESQAHVPFAQIKSLQDLDRSLAQAAERGRVSMLDFYADWCVECKRMEQNTFPEPGVKALLDQMDAMQADVTAYDEVDQELMKAFDIIGPPAILFFDTDGREMKAYRLVGYFGPEEFAGHLQSVFAAQ